MALGNVLAAIPKLQLTAGTHLIWTGGPDSSSSSSFGSYGDSVLKVKSARLYNVRPTTKSDHNTEQTADFLLLCLSATLFPTSSSSSLMCLLFLPLSLSSVLFLLLFFHASSTFLFLVFILPEFLLPDCVLLSFPQTFHHLPYLLLLTSLTFVHSSPPLLP